MRISLLLGTLALVVLAAPQPAAGQTVRVHCRAFADLNGDGVWQAPGEPALPGIRITNGADVRATRVNGTIDLQVDLADYRFVTLTIPAGRWPTTPWYRRYDGASAPADTVLFGLRDHPASAADPVSWIHICDTQVTGTDDIWDLGRDLETINAASRDALFIVNAGDIVNVGGDRNDWNGYVAQLARAQLPVFHAVGNHDTVGTATPLALYEEYVGPPYYSLEAGSWHFIVYDRYPGGVTRQDAWLAADVAAAPPGARLVLVQHDMAREAPASVRAAWAALGVRAVFSGHWHSHQFSITEEGIEDYNIGRLRSGPLDRSPRAFGIVTMTAHGAISYDLRRFGANRRVAVTSPGAKTRVGGRDTKLVVQAYDTAQRAVALRAVATDSLGHVAQVPLTAVGPSLWSGPLTLDGFVPGPCTLAVAGSWEDGQAIVAGGAFRYAGPERAPRRPDTEWPMFRRTADGHGHQEHPVEPPLELAWVTATPGAVMLSSPVVAGGRVYLGFRAQARRKDAGLMAFAAASGDPVWFAPVSGGVALAPVVAGDVVVANGVSGHAYGFAAATGAELWRLPMPLSHYNFMAPVTAGTDVLVGGEPHVYSVAPATGAVTWQSGNLGTNWFPYMYSAPAVAADFVYLGGFGLPDGQGGGNTGRFTVLERGAGRTIFADLDGAYRSALVAGDTVYVVGAVDRSNQVLTARDRNGAVLWTAAKNLGRGTGSPVLAHGVLVVPGRDGAIEAFDARTGANLWTHPVGTPLFDMIAGVLGWGRATFSTPAIADRTVFVGSADGHLYGLDLMSGEVQVDIDLGTPINSSPALAGNMIFVAAGDGHLYAFVGAGEPLPAAVGGETGLGPRIRFALPAPNPGRGPFALGYALPAAARVDIAIYDVRGRLVRTLAAGDATAGEHALTWTGTDASGRRAAAGVYFAVMKAGGQRLVRKLTLTRE